MNSDVLDTFNLKSGMFATCSGIWDEKTQKYKLADSTEMAICCTQNCIHPIKYCQQYCYNNIDVTDPKILSRCLGICNDMRQMCMDTCRVSSPYIGVDNNYILCANKYGCEGIKELPNVDCVKKHKESIFECCRKSCIPNRDLDCQKHCEFLQKVTLDPRKIGIPKTSKNTLNMLASRFKIYPDNTWLYISIGIIISIIMIIFWINIRKQK